MRTHGRRIAPRRRRLLAALALALGAGVALRRRPDDDRARGGVRADVGGAATSRFVLNMSVAPATLDPAEACGFTDITVMENVYMRLTRYGSNPARRAPRRWIRATSSLLRQVVEDLERWQEVHLHASARPQVPEREACQLAGREVLLQSLDHDGRLRRLLHLRRHLYAALIKSMETPNPTTFVVNLSVPDANVLQDWAQPAASIIDKSVVDAHGGVQKGKVNTWMASHIAGIGPFTMKSYEANKQAVLTATPGFFAPAKTKEIVINWIPPTRRCCSRHGPVPQTSRSASRNQSVHSLETNSSVKVIANDTSIGEWLGLPNDHPPFNNVKFRAAMSYAVPYQQILKGRLRLRDVVLRRVPTGNARVQKEPRAAAHAEHREGKGADCGVRGQHAGDRATRHPGGNSNDEQVATIVQGTWAQLGVNVQINKLSASDYINKLETHKSQAFIRLEARA
jgi:peptide/nickel transport system substrate-binding protein